MGRRLFQQGNFTNKPVRWQARTEEFRRDVGRRGRKIQEKQNMVLLLDGNSKIGVPAIQGAISVIGSV